MPLSGEQIFVRCLKSGLLIGTAYILFCLGSFMATACWATRYPAAVKWPALLYVFTVAAYSKLDFLSQGLFNLRVNHVRIAAACVFSVELAVAVLLGRQLSGCQSVDGVLVLPTFLVLFYTAFAASLLFGDAWLGVIRNAIRFGKRPFDFSNPDGPKPIAIPRRAPRRSRKRRR